MSIPIIPPIFTTDINDVYHYYNFCSSTCTEIMGTITISLVIAVAILIVIAVCGLILANTCKNPCICIKYHNYRLVNTDDDNNRLLINNDHDTHYMNEEAL